MQSLSSVNTQSWLSWFFKGLLALGICILLGRLVELQIIKGAYYHDLAEGNRIRRVPITAPRGEILARGGEVLVGNKEVKKKVEFKPESGYEKKEADSDTPSDEVISEWIRDYKEGSVFAHTGGYLGEANEAEVSKVDGNCLEKGIRKLGSFVGRGGLEEQYDCLLRGYDGEELVEVDTLGKKIRTIGRKQAISGESLETTIDLELQRKTAEAMKDKVGGVVITDGKGEILAIYSSPSYDPNVFVKSDETNSAILANLFIDPALPLFNRVIGGAYHPGSIFKIVTAVAALEEGKIDKDYKYEDPGVIRVNEFSYYNWYLTQYGGTEGVINLERAIARSTDTFFYKLGELVGPESLVKWAKQFGLGENTGVDLPGEIQGLLPSPEWKKAMKGERWFLGNTYHMAIGQGDLTTTVLEANIITSVIASDGQLCTPHVVSEKQECREIGIKKETLDEIKNGMLGACSEGGTAYPFFDFGVKVACKTGTAETNEEDVTHAWFTVMAPAESPEIVVTVLVEKGGEGSKVAAPIAREILDYWMVRKNP
jgi:penicillin-binding protein 2